MLTSRDLWDAVGEREATALDFADVQPYVERSVCRAAELSF